MLNCHPKVRLAGQVFLALLLFGCFTAHADWFRYQQTAMGTQISVELWHSNATDAEFCADQVFKEMRRIDALMSPWKPDSDLSAINNNAAIMPVKTSDELYDLIQRSISFSNLSGGAFDITFASVGHQYDYRLRKKPDAETLSSSLPAINYNHIELRDGSVFFRHSNVRIDLGGIAKGYAVERGIGILRDCDIKSAMVSAGGDSKIMGDHNGRPWSIGVKHPRQAEKIMVTLPLSDIAISTSGDYERFFIDNGDRVHHIIDPGTGLSAGNSWTTTVIGPDATTTDALSTAIFVLGARDGLALIEQQAGYDAVIVDNQGKMYYSSGLQTPGGAN